MALLWIDGFEKYGPTGSSSLPADVLIWKYGGIFPEYVNIVAGRDGGKCMRVDHTATYLQTPMLCLSSNTLIVGLAFNMVNLTNNQWIFDLRDATNYGETLNYNQFTLKIASVGTKELRLYRGNTVLATTSTLNLQPSTWYYVEMKVNAHNTTGTCNVRIAEGSTATPVEVISFSGDTLHRSDPYCRVQFHIVSSELLLIDDMYVCDDSGTTCNDFQGNCKVETLSPVADVETDWLVNTGSDLYAVIDEDRMDANYIYDYTSGNQATFETTNLSGNNTNNIRGVMLCCDSHQTGNSVSYAKGLTQNGSGGTIQHTANYAPGADEPLCWTHIMEENPDGDPWTESLVNDLRIGVELS
jgi:hypothetical protein